MLPTRRRRNPELAEVITPSGVDRLEWYKTFMSGYTFGRDLVLGEAREKLEQNFLLAQLPTREELSKRNGAAEAAAEVIAHANFPVTDFWVGKSPEKVASIIVDEAFGNVAGEKAAQRALTEAKKMLAGRIRRDAKDVGLSLSAPEPFAAIPKPPRPPRPPKASRPVAKPASERPASARPASARPASARPASARPASARPASARAASERPVFDVPEERPASERAASQRGRKRRKPAPAPRPVDDRYAEQRTVIEGRTPPEKLADATLRAERLDFYRDADGRLSSRLCPKDRRLDGFWDSLLGYRPDYMLPPELLRTYRKDVVIALLPRELVAQVWTKGQLTEVFSAPRVGRAFDTAVKYVDRWRGLGEDGEIRSDAKRSRLDSAVYVTNYVSQTEVGPVELVAEPLYDRLFESLMDADEARRLANPRRAPRPVTIIRVRRPRTRRKAR